MCVGAARRMPASAGKCLAAPTHMTKAKVAAPSSLVPDPHTMDVILAKAYGVSRVRKMLSRLAAPFAGRILKIIWWLTRPKGK